jgi:trimeric autotransporter adhesin
MKTFFQPLLFTLGALAISITTYGTQPPDVVSSDSQSNTAMGTSALLDLTYGASNTAAGFQALDLNTGGGWNTAFGAAALSSNTTGEYNTAVGYQALTGAPSPTFSTGGSNTAVGAGALYFDTTGDFNTAAGSDALFSNTSADYNAAFGEEALSSNRTGAANTATGAYSLFYNTVGNYNTASGYNSLQHNKSGENNSAFGRGALESNTVGGYNTAVGFHAGYYITNGSNNIDIGNVGKATDGVAAQSGVIRIGTSAQQTQTFIAGINNSTVTGAAVVVDATTGQLGVLASSERFKTAIAPMGAATAKLAQLRPVSFKLKSDATGTRQYGLIAEEVVKIYPELVIRDGSGQINGVRYDELAPMLLNESQQQRSTIAEQSAEIRDLKQQMAEMKDLKQQLQAALAKTQTRDELTARR